jgi:hypothetical protein
MRKRILMAGLVGLTLLVGLFGLVGSAAAADQSITVTATGEYLVFTFTGGNWTLNSGNPINANTWFYSNPLGETTAPSNPVTASECTNTVTNTGNVAIDITVKWADMTGTGDPWTNSDAGTNGSMVFGGKAQIDGVNWSAAVVAKNTATYNTLISDLAAAGHNHAVFGLYSPTAFTDGNAKSSSITLTATEHV